MREFRFDRSPITFEKPKEGCWVKGQLVAEVIGWDACRSVAEWATESFSLLVFNSYEDLLTFRKLLTGEEIDLAKAALKERPWVWVVTQNLLKPIDGLVMAGMPGLDHRGKKVIPVRYGGGGGNPSAAFTDQEVLWSENTHHLAEEAQRRSGGAAAGP